MQENVMKALLDEREAQKRARTGLNALISDASEGRVHTQGCPLGGLFETGSSDISGDMCWCGAPEEAERRRAAPQQPGPVVVSFKGELTHLINKYSLENASNTPDFILASFVSECLASFNVAIAAREKWYGRDPSRGPAQVNIGSTVPPRPDLSSFTQPLLPADEALALPWCPSPWIVGDRVYHRHADMFGKIESIDGADAMVRYEYPHDGSYAVKVPMRELTSAAEAEARNG